MTESQMNYIKAVFLQVINKKKAPHSGSRNQLRIISCRIYFSLIPGDPDKELNPKKKVWEQVQPDLRTDQSCVATYKGAAFEVAGKGVCRAQTMSNSGIK